MFDEQPNREVIRGYGDCKGIQPHVAARSAMELLAVTKKRNERGSI